MARQDLLGITVLENMLAHENDPQLPEGRPRKPRIGAVKAITDALARWRKEDARLSVRVRVFPDVHDSTEIEVKRTKKAVRTAVEGRTTAQWQCLSKAIRVVVGGWPICDAWSKFNQASGEEGFGLVGSQNRVRWHVAPRHAHAVENTRGLERTRGGGWGAAGV
jgi:hypothetical protein